MVTHIRKMLKRETGATMVEYAIIVSLLSIVAIGAIRLIGPEITEQFEDVQDALD